MVIVLIEMLARGVFLDFINGYFTVVVVPGLTRVGEG